MKRNAGDRGAQSPPAVNRSMQESSCTSPSPSGRGREKPSAASNRTDANEHLEEGGTMWDGLGQKRSNWEPSQKIETQNFLQHNLTISAVCWKPESF